MTLDSSRKKKKRNRRGYRLENAKKKMKVKQYKCANKEVLTLIQ